MAWKATDRVVDIQISSSKQSSPSWGTTLTGSGHGFNSLTHSQQRVYEDKEGFVAGIAPVNDTGRYEANDVTYSVELDDTTKVILGKEGQYLYIRDRVYNGSTLKITYTIEGLIVSCPPTVTAGGIMKMDVTLKTQDYNTTVA